MKLNFIHSVTVLLGSFELADAQVAAGSTHEQTLQTCYIGDLNIRCERGGDCPPCWILKGNQYHCYDHVNGLCPSWNRMFDRTYYTSYPANICYRGNNNRLPCQADKERCPPCWIKSGTKYACFDYVNSRCPWPSMYDMKS